MGQYPREFEKISKELMKLEKKGDKDKEISLAKIYASKITDYKASTEQKCFAN